MNAPLDVEERTRRLGRVLAALERILDWELLGTLYCEEGGRDFFCADQRDALVRAGMEFAGELAGRLRPAGAGSLYLGAAVFELFPALFEVVVLERSVELVNLEGPEARELDRGLALAEEETGVALPRIATTALAELAGPPRDHLWMTSVLTDPEAFPALHDALYERAGTDLATGRGELASERGAASALVRALLARRAPTAWITTTDEELPLVRAVAAELGLALRVPDTARLSGVVGDPVRHVYASADAGGDLRG